MRYGSICSGIEAATVAWHLLGWEAAWFSEIAPFPSAVLDHYYPTVPNLGDMTRLTGLINRGEIDAPDIVCGGTPCQAFSVSGHRRSLDDDRGNLSLVFCEVCDAVDDVRRNRGKDPAIILWENVPGVLSTHDNAFGCLLAGLAGESAPINAPNGRWPSAGIVVGTCRNVAWRVLDAQYFGLAQRRKRVFVISSARADIDIGQILFEFTGVQRLARPSREARQDNTRTVTHSIDNAGKQTINKEISHTLKASNVETVFIDHGAASDTVSMSMGAFQQRMTITTELAQTLKAQSYDAIFTNVSVGVQDVSPTLRANGSPMNGTGNINSPLAFSIQGNIIGREHGGAQGAGISDENISYTLTTTDRHAVAFNENHVVNNIKIRRLTPRECERLQGFPDDYTLIPYKGKPAGDSLRYHALGNSWAVPVVRWIGQRIIEVMEATNGVR